MTESSTDTPDCTDLLVIGGGINGAGIAADAAGRGLSVTLVEKGDLASGTSSWSTKLIHGGLRYLEFYEFGLVRKALLERDVLTRAAPHIIKPLAFNIPQLPTSRPAIMLRAGLFLYDFLAKSSIFKHSRAIKFKSGSPLVPNITRGFEYWDAQVDDSRLVLLNAQQAQAKGATIQTYTECVALAESPTQGGGWLVTLRDSKSGAEHVVRARVVVNAAGPWVARLLEKLFAKKPPLGTRLVKGSHIVVPKLHDGSQAFMLQHTDGRVIFVIPYLDKYSLIGTTEAEFEAGPEGALEGVKISSAEIDYLIEVSNNYFTRQLDRSSVVSTYSGVRPLIDEEGKDATKVSRDYHLEPHKGTAPLLSVYGGKVTTYRTLAEDVMREIEGYFPAMAKPWTKEASLPGGDFTNESDLEKELRASAPWLASTLLTRWRETYGSATKTLLKGLDSESALGELIGADLYTAEVDYLIEYEWARSAEDILWRRTKLGYLFDAGAVDALDAYVKKAIG